MAPRWSVAAVVLSLSAFALGCSGASVGFKLDRPPLRTTRLISLAELFPGAEGPGQVFEVHGAPDAPGEILIVGSHGAAWVDGSGNLRRRVELEDAADLSPVRAVWVAPEPGFVAQTGHSGGEMLQLFDTEGRRTTTAITHSETDLFALDLRDDGIPMVVAQTPSGHGVTAFDLEGRTLWIHDAHARVADLEPVPAAAGRPPGVVVYLYPVDGAGQVRILEGHSGRVTAIWSAPAVSDFAVTPDGLWTLLGDELVLCGFDGEVLDRLRAPQVGRFSHLETRLLFDGRRVTLVSGDDPVEDHMLLIHDIDGRLVYRRTRQGLARGLYAMESRIGLVTLYYGVGDEVWSLRGV